MLPTPTERGIICAHNAIKGEWKNSRLHQIPPSVDFSRIEIPLKRPQKSF